MKSCAHIGAKRIALHTALLGVLVLAARMESAAQPRARQESLVRAAYVSHLSKYVEWPTERVERTLYFFRGSTVQAAMHESFKGGARDTFDLRTVLASDDALAAQCEVLYVGANDATNLEHLLGKVKGRPVLTIGETEDFVKQGGVMALVRQNDQIQIDTDNAQASSLRLSPFLLSLSNVVCHRMRESR